MTKLRLPRVAGALIMTVILGTLLIAEALPASADTAPEYCTLDLSTGSFTCTTTPTPAGLLVLPGSQTVLGRFYDDPYKSLTHGWFQVTASSGCDGLTGLDWSVPVMPSGWNDRISSFQAYANCDVRLFANGGLTGSVYGPATSANTLGSMDNQTSSIGFY